MKCKSCGSEEDYCYPGCGCAKCVDPEGYESWKENNPEQYERWLERQRKKEEREYYG